MLVGPTSGNIIDSDEILSPCNLIGKYTPIALAGSDTIDSANSRKHKLPSTPAEG